LSRSNDTEQARLAGTGLGGARPGGSRFLAVSLAAFAIDVMLVLALRTWLGLSVTASAAIAFAAVGSVAYLAHEHWTFRRVGARASARRWLQTLVSLGLAFCVRVGVIAALEAVRAPDLAITPVYVGAGAGASLCVNYLLSRFWVFHR